MLNFANILTMSRIAAIPAIVGLLLIQGLVWHWIALALFILACVTDWFDGYVARRLDQVSPLGRFLDPIADKLVVAAVLLILVSIGHIDGWAILAGPGHPVPRDPGLRPARVPGGAAGRRAGQHAREVEDRACR